MTRLVFIGGPPGVGKTSVARELAQRIPDCAWLDGDDVWRIHPFDPTESRKRMVERNISFVLRGFLAEGIGTVLLSWVLHRRDLIDRLVDSLGTTQFELHLFTLLSSPDVLRARFESDPDRGVLDERALERLRQCAALEGVTPIDTDGRGVDAVVDQILRSLRSL